jgi:Protein of unknown function (DUF4199)
MEANSKYTIGIRFGLLAALIYIILLFLRYNYFAGSPVTFGLFAVVSFIIILMVYLFAGIARKKQLGGFADMKEIFQSIFIVILITEIVYIIFNFIYLKYVDPSFWTDFKATTLSFLESKNVPEDQIDQQMKSFKDVDQSTKPFGLLKGFGYSVIIDSIFGLIFAAILRRKKPIFDEILEEPKL